MLNTFNCGLNAHTTGGSSRCGIMAGNANCFSIVHIPENNRQSAPSRRRMAHQDVDDKRWRKGGKEKKLICAGNGCLVYLGRVLVLCEIPRDEANTLRMLDYYFFFFRLDINEIYPKKDG